ncbi:hypothetical protein ACFONN_02930 [Dyella humi]|uniref:Uncharacterized protein n=1 Tax=Dyella humi TaxID=1770547 RepID=A0ABW8IFS9_9GAMM
MMTSENNAKRMLTKAAAFPFCAGRAVNRDMRRVGALMLMCMGLVACSYRASDKTALQARTTASESVAIAVGESNANASIAHKETQDAQKAATFSLTEMVQDRAKPAAPIADATSSDGSKRRLVPSTERVVGDASVFLSADGAPASDDDHVDKSDASAPSTPIAKAIASDESDASAFPWAWLLAISALIAGGGVGFGLARYRQRRMTVGREIADSDDKAWEQKDVQAAPSTVLEHDVSVTPEPVALTVDGDALSVTADAATGPIPFSLLEWSYQPAEYEGREHWDVLSPVDFLPVSLSAQEASDSSLAAAAEVAEEVHFHEQSEDLPIPTLALSDHPLSQLFDQLESFALHESSDIPGLLIERGSDLPEVICTTGESAPSEVLQAWESTLRQALPDAQELMLPWLLVSTLLLRADDVNNRDAEALYAEAEEWIELSMTADHERSATWQARGIDIDLRRAKRQKGAARLLSLRAMQSQYAPQLAQGEPPLLFAWVDVLMFWAQCQFGDAALARYAEAEAICLRLSELPTSTDAAQRCRAEILRQRATIEEGGARLNSLDTAQALVDALYERVPNADNALAIAITALARGNVLPPEQAKEVYSYALMYAFMAEGEPRLRTESLQCRLAVQWAYESLPGTGVQSNVAMNLVARLEALHVQHPDTLQRMAQTYLRSSDFAHACELCESAWRSGHATPALLATWQEACLQWETVSTLPEQLVVRQQTMRQLSIASAMR